MRKTFFTLLVLLLIPILSACRQESPNPGIDMNDLRQDIQQKTEELFRIHLKLDTAISEISEAEAAAREGNTSGAEFHAAEAYRSLVQADESLLDLGRELQAMVNLDVENTGR